MSSSSSGENQQERPGKWERTEGTSAADGRSSAHKATPTGREGSGATAAGAFKLRQPLKVSDEFRKKAEIKYPNEPQERYGEVGAAPGGIPSRGIPNTSADLLISLLPW